MTLEDSLRFSGYTIDAYEFPGVAIAVGGGSIAVPPMILSRLTWHRDYTPPLDSAFYLDKLPPFHPAYAPVQLSLILDRFRSRRLGYDTPDQFGLAVRRWGALHMGATSTLARLYRSVAVDLPLDTVSLVVSDTSLGESSTTEKADTIASSTGEVKSNDKTDTNAKGRDAQSDYPQGQLSGSLDYASGAVDSLSAGNVTGEGTTNSDGASEDHKTGSTTAKDERTSERTEKGRSGQSIMQLLSEQRESFENYDEQFLNSFESLFLGVFDRSENERDYPGSWVGRGYGYGW
jgi:hypothetical protein